MAKLKRNYSSRTMHALKIFALQIQVARKQHGWSEAELAERVGASRPTIRQIEQGNPATGLGLYFEVATLLGLPLFAEDEAALKSSEDRLGLQLALLPKRISKDEGEVFDDF